MTESQGGGSEDVVKNAGPSADGGSSSRKWIPCKSESRRYVFLRSGVENRRAGVGSIRRGIRNRGHLATLFGGRGCKLPADTQIQRQIWTHSVIVLQVHAEQL